MRRGKVWICDKNILCNTANLADIRLEAFKIKFETETGVVYIARYPIEGNAEIKFDAIKEAIKKNTFFLDIAI